MTRYETIDFQKKLRDKFQMTDRKRLQPINTNQIIQNNSIPRLTRSNYLNSTYGITDCKKIGLDENNYNLHMKSIYVNVSDVVKVDECKSPKIRKRLESSSTTSTESIPDCKSLNAECPVSLMDVGCDSAQNINTDVKDNIVQVSTFYYDPTKNHGRQNVEKINVPSWRKICKPKSRTRRSSSSSCVEDLSDEIFKRRHEKYECDEKKVEKEMEKSMKVSRKSYASFNAQHFIPSVQKKKWKNVVPKSLNSEMHDNYHISIEEKVPVTAFGVQIPKFYEKPFTISQRNK